MWINDKIFLIYGCSLRNLIFRVVVGGGVSWKSQYLGGGACIKREAWIDCKFKRGLGKKRGGVVFKRGLVPYCTLWLPKTESMTHNLNVSVKIKHLGHITTTSLRILTSPSGLQLNSILPMAGQLVLPNFV